MIVKNGNFMRSPKQLPGDIQEGDLLVFHNAAAYSEACKTTFNGMASPAVHYLDELRPI
jgi:diaminopimelate decarboxylase